jgi:hypothetical protein
LLGAPDLLSGFRTIPVNSNPESLSKVDEPQTLIAVKRKRREREREIVAAVTLAPYYHSIPFPHSEKSLLLEIKLRDVYKNNIENIQRAHAHTCTHAHMHTHTHTHKILEQVAQVGPPSVGGTLLLNSK